MNIIERFRKYRKGGILKFQNSGIIYKVNGITIDSKSKRNPSTAKPQSNTKKRRYTNDSEGQSKFAGDMYESLYRAYNQIYNIKHEDAVKLAKLGVIHKAHESGYGSSNLSANNNYGGYTTGKQNFNNMDEFAENYAWLMLNNYPATVISNTIEDYVNALYHGKDGRKYCTSESQESYTKKLRGCQNRSLKNIQLRVNSYHK